MLLHTLDYRNQVYITPEGGYIRSNHPRPPENGRGMKSYATTTCRSQEAEALTENTVTLMV